MNATEIEPAKSDLAADGEPGDAEDPRIAYRPVDGERPEGMRE